MEGQAGIWDSVEYVVLNQIVLMKL